MFLFCKPAYSRKRFLPHRALDKSYNFSLFENASEVPAQDWEKVVGTSHLFFNLAYLSILERGSFSKMQCRYVILYEAQQPRGILYFQVIDFKAGIFGDLFNKQVEKNTSRRLSIFEKYVDSNRNETFMRLVTCGNNLVSGPYGFHMPDIEPEIASALLLELTDLIAKEDKLKGGISAVLIKDFHEPLQPALAFRQKRYNDFKVEPNLVVTLPANVTTLLQYLELFSKKYRNRSRSVIKACSQLEQRYLPLSAILEQEAALFALYTQIFNKAKFKLIKLPADYFSSVKRLFGEQFVVKAFYKEGTLMAFASAFVMPDKSLEAHYIGMDYNFNAEYCLYQNILLCMINEGLLHGCDRVNLGRTASEIKTTVGAKPVDLICYIKPQNTISKIIQKPFISFLQPGEWIPRNPFRDENPVMQVDKEISADL